MFDAPYVSPLTMDQIVVDLVNRSIQRGARRTVLTPGEFSLLLFFLRDRGRVFDRDEIIQQIRGSDYPVTQRSVDVRVAALRRKLGELGELVETIRGVGYRFREDPLVQWSLPTDSAGESPRSIQPAAPSATPLSGDI